MHGFAAGLAKGQEQEAQGAAFERRPRRPRGRSQDFERHRQIAFAMAQPQSFTDACSRGRRSNVTVRPLYPG